MLQELGALLCIMLLVEGVSSAARQILVHSVELNSDVMILICLLHFSVSVYMS